MLIGIDARMYGPKQGGLGRYIEQLILHLEKINSNDKFVIFLRQENWEEYSPANPRFKKILADVPWYGVKEQLALPKIIAKQKVDLMHFPHWNVPMFYKEPFVVTIHDLLLLHYPTRRASTLGPFFYWLKNSAFKKVLKHAANSARHILTPSLYTKNDIHGALKVPLEKITVTHLAPFAKSQINYNGQNSKSFLKTKYGITKPYVLYVGVAYPHKNLAGLIAAWKIFIEKYGNNYQLVLAGKRNYFYNRLLNNRALEQLNNSLVFTDFVPDSELASLYQNASLYVMPSLYEGFALPSLEAMRYGLPVASSDAACLPEILKDAAIYFNPEDKKAMADAIFSALTDTETRVRLIKNSQKIIGLYSWENCAKKTLEIYQKMV